jgi:hypothetical protein
MKSALAGPIAPRDHGRCGPGLGNLRSEGTGGSGMVRSNKCIFIVFNRRTANAAAGSKRHA